jgi:hypothetical protein
MSLKFPKLEGVQNIDEKFWKVQKRKRIITKLNEIDFIDHNLSTNWYYTHLEWCQKEMLNVVLYNVVVLGPML